MSDEAPLAPAVRVASLGLLAIFLIAGALTRRPSDPALSTAATVLAMVAATASSRRRPPLALALTLLAGVAVVINADGHSSDVGLMGLCALAFLCVLTAWPNYGPLFAAASLGWLGEQLASTGDFGWLPWIGGVLAASGGAWALAREERLHARLRAAQAELAERSRVEERARIARDLHDVIAHSLTVALMHISVARLSVEHDPADAARALAEAEQLGRDSLNEVRSIVGLMRAPTSAAEALAPTPGLDRIEELVDKFRAAGAPITFELCDGLEGVPGTVSTTAYRIAQEALTNAARHAPGSTVTVRLAASGADLELSVDSSGRPGDGRGNGLDTMRERAEAVGGRLAAGPAPVSGATGWRVRALLPTGRNGRRGEGS